HRRAARRRARCGHHPHRAPWQDPHARRRRRRARARARDGRVSTPEGEPVAVPGAVPGPGAGAGAAAGSSLGRNAAILASGTAVSRVLGVVRTSLLFAAIGGVGLSANSFDLANKLPNMITMLVAGGVLNAVLVPQVVRAYQTDKGDDYTRRLLTLGALVLLAITVLCTAAAGLVVHLFALRAGDDLRNLATVFAV